MQLSWDGEPVQEGSLNYSVKCVGFEMIKEQQVKTSSKHLEMWALQKSTNQMREKTASQMGAMCITAWLCDSDMQTEVLWGRDTWGGEEQASAIRERPKTCLSWQEFGWEHCYFPRIAQPFHPYWGQVPCLPCSPDIPGTQWLLGQVIGHRAWIHAYISEWQRQLCTVAGMFEYVPVGFTAKI